MIGPLLEISTTPARYEYQVQRARLEISQEQPTVQRTVRRASLNMQRQSGKLEMNSVRRRSDMGFKGVVDRANFEGDRGRQAAIQATGDYASFGNQIANFHKGANIPDALWSQTMQRSGGDLVLIPVSPVDIHYIPENLAIDFQPGQMESNWNIGRARLDFVPGSFSLNFTQYASVDIKYIGGFNYAPPSADPNYVGQA